MKGTVIYHSPVGDIQLDYEDGAVVALKHADTYVKVGEPTELTKQVFVQLDEYFAGTRQTFDFPYRLHGTPFQEKVWAALQEIPYGETRSYQDIAKAIGNPKACRAVGMANHANPIFIVIPCHRVIGANGSLVGYGGGLEMKKALLELEKSHVREAGISLEERKTGDIMSPIPTMTDPRRYTDNSFVDSKFVELKSCELWDVKMLYPILKMEHAENQCFVRREVYERLCAAAANLPKGYRFRIWDAWRPFALQHELFEKYSVDIIREFGLEDKPGEEQKAVICKFVSDPVADTKVPPVHTTGGAIDLTILDPDGRELEMGCGFDAFTDKTCASYFEMQEHISSAMQERFRQNRRLLYFAMTDAGFTNLPSEWWHYDYGDRFWAYYQQKPAMYEGIFTKEEIHE